MIFNTKKITLSVLAIILCGFLVNSNTLAASKKFAVSPMNQRVVLIPGESYQGAITVAVPSESEESFNYNVSIAPYSLSKSETTDSDFGGSDFSTITNANQIIDWIVIDNPIGIINPNEHRTVSFTINVPKDAPAGGQYAALLIKEDDSANKDDGGMAVKEIMQMSHIIYAEVAGETKKEAIITENKIPTFLLSNKLSASSSVINNGNIHTDAEYTLQIWPLSSDEEIFTNEENPEKIFILPNVTKYHNQEVSLPSIGIFRVRQTIKIFGETSIVEKTVIVCPIWLLFLIIFGLTAIVIYFIARAKARRAERRAAE